MDGSRATDNDNNSIGDDSDLWKQQTLLVDECDVGLLSQKVAAIVSPVLARHKGGGLSLDDFCSLMMIEVNAIGPGAITILRNNPTGECSTGGDGTTRALTAKERSDAIVYKFHPEINKNR